MSGEATITAPPPWLEDAVQAFVVEALEAEFDPTRADGRRRLSEALATFARTGKEHDPASEHTEFAFYALMASLSTLANQLAPEEQRGSPDAPIYLAAEDMTTGTEIGDVDAELDTDADRGALAALRFHVANANGEHGLALALARAAAASFDAVAAMILTLAEMTGGAMAEDAVQQGLVPDAVRAAWDARRAADPPAPPEPEVIRRGGRDWIRQPGAVQDRDAAMPHGLGTYVSGIYVPGTRLTAAAVAASAHEQIRAYADAGPDSPPLCGVEHWEEIEAWQLPRELRTAANRGLRAAARQAGRPAALVRCWQHHPGHCPDAPPDPEDRTPGPDEVALFEDPDLAAELDALTHPTGPTEEPPR